MKKLKLLTAALTLCVASCDPSYVRPTENSSIPYSPSFDREIQLVMENGIVLDERKKQIPAIISVFSRRTDPVRARWLATLCYAKTLETDWKPIDLAEIALAETGSHGLSPRAVSHKGALGVWQLMPSRAKSHGFSPDDMINDEKCAEAAVLELEHKLEMARGNQMRAKKLYCGVGPEADAYEVKRKQFRKEIVDELRRMTLEAMTGGMLLATAK